MTKKIIFLGIETSCDETAASVIRENDKGTADVLSNIVSSQISEHKKFGGVVPELAARAHLENIDYIIEAALEESKVSLKEIDGIAATAGPGLIVCLTVGLNIGKSIAAFSNKPFVAVNHTYQEIGLFPKAIVSGGTGIYYSADNIWILGRQQDKKGTDIQGYHFVINVEKSRYVKEKSKIPITVSWEGGVQKYSGLLDVALETGHVVKPSAGWYQRNGDDKKVRHDETLQKEFWDPIFEGTEFRNVIQHRYKI